MTERFAAVGRVRRAHGLKGELVVEPLTDEPGALFAPGRRVFVGDLEGAPLTAPDGGARVATITGVRPFQDTLLVLVDQCTDRTEADRWRGRYLLVPMAELPEPADDEAWLHELPGFAVVDPAGAPLGEVAGWYALPHGLVIEVRTPRGVRDVPFTEAFVQVERAARRLVVDAPEGLLE